MEPLLYVGIVQALFTAVFLETRTNSSLNDRVLAVWMVLIALPFLSGVTVRALPDTFIPIISSDLIYPLTYGPFILFYVGSLTGDIARLKTAHYIHFLSFVRVSIV